MKGNFATIVIDGKLSNIEEDDLSPGDVVVLQAGEIVPADLRLLEARGLEIDEFDITGEILPVGKKVGGVEVRIYMGSRVIRGTGLGVVTAAGGQTEYGRVLAQESEQNGSEDIPIFNIKHLGLAGLLLPAFLFHLSRSGHPFSLTAGFVFCYMAVILLLNGQLFNRLIRLNEQKYYEKSNFQIRDYRALEKMNEINLICFDKTGVLTGRAMDVRQVYFPDKGVLAEDENHPAGLTRMVHTACALCNDVSFVEKTGLASPIDKALISFASKNGVHLSELLPEYKRIYDLPFEPENRFMVSGFERCGREAVYFAKGDPGVIFGMCSTYLAQDGTLEKVNFKYWCAVKSIMETIHRAGDSVIALAYTPGSFEGPPARFTFLCLIQLENALQHGALETVNWLTEKGIRNILLTGDSERTAERIAGICGISTDSKASLNGKILDRMEISEVARQASYCSVFARLLPSQKSVLLRLFQQKGYCVAMIGDGPNDGLALKAADVSISFVTQSSPIARRLSKILINDLADLPVIIARANRMHSRKKTFHRLRFLAAAGILVALYASVFV